MRSARNVRRDVSWQYGRYPLPAAPRPSPSRACRPPLRRSGARAALDLDRWPTGLPSGSAARESLVDEGDRQASSRSRRRVRPRRSARGSSGSTRADRRVKIIGLFPGGGRADRGSCADARSSRPSGDRWPPASSTPGSAGRTRSAVRGSREDLRVVGVAAGERGLAVSTSRGSKPGSTPTRRVQQPQNSNPAPTTSTSESAISDTTRPRRRRVRARPGATPRPPASCSARRSGASPGRRGGGRRPGPS